MVKLMTTCVIARPERKVQPKQSRFFAYRRFLPNNGVLLLEVLIGATVLSVGILACLHIFSGAIHASQQSLQTEKMQNLLNQTLFEWFLDPTSFDASGESTIDSGDPLIQARIRVESLSQPEQAEDQVKDKSQNEDKSKTTSKLVKPSNVEFFKVTFLGKYQNQKSSREYNTCVFRYGLKKDK